MKTLFSTLVLCFVLAFNATAADTNNNTEVSAPEAFKTLMTAAKIGDLYQLEEALEVVNINETTSTGATSLMIAAKWGNLKAVKYLIDNGADVTARNKNGLDARAFAIAYGHSEIAELLSRESL